MSDEPVTFLASIAPTDGGLRIHGIDGYRVLLDIPNDELAAIVRLALFRGQVLRVTVEAVEQVVAEPTKKRKKRKGLDNGATEDRDRYFEG